MTSDVIGLTRIDLKWAQELFRAGVNNGVNLVLAYEEEAKNETAIRVDRQSPTEQAIDALSIMDSEGWLTLPPQTPRGHSANYQFAANRNCVSAWHHLREMWPPCPACLQKCAERLQEDLTDDAGNDCGFGYRAEVLLECQMCGVACTLERWYGGPLAPLNFTRAPARRRPALNQPMAPLALKPVPSPAPPSKQTGLFGERPKFAAGGAR